MVSDLPFFGGRPLGRVFYRRMTCDVADLVPDSDACPSFEIHRQFSELESVLYLDGFDVETFYISAEEKRAVKLHIFSNSAQPFQQHA